MVSLSSSSLRTAYDLSSFWCLPWEQGEESKIDRKEYEWDEVGGGGGGGEEKEEGGGGGVEKEGEEEEEEGGGEEIIEKKTGRQ